VGEPLRDGCPGVERASLQQDGRIAPAPLGSDEESGGAPSG
jgi:hypothetical protein